MGIRGATAEFAEVAGQGHSRGESPRPFRARKTSCPHNDEDDQGLAPDYKIGTENRLRFVSDLLSIKGAICWRLPRRIRRCPADFAEKETPVQMGGYE